MSKLFYIVGVVLSAAGFISGIVTGTVTESFPLCLLVWLSTFLYVIIYFGIGFIIDNQEDIMNKLNSVSNKTETHISETNYLFKDNSPIFKDQPSKSVPSGEWKCPKCGRVNGNYVGTCGCGTSKSSSVHRWRCSNCGEMTSYEICPKCGHSN